MWYYNGKPYLEIHSQEVIGFIYQIDILSTGQSYIGKKQFYSTRKIAKPKKELKLQTDKRLSKKKIVVKESDWKTYKSSSDIVKKLDEKDLKKTILFFCTTLRELTYQECKLLFCNGVLESDKWLNKNIMNKIFNVK